MKTIFAIAGILVLGCGAEPEPKPTELTQASVIFPPTTTDNLDILQPLLKGFAPKAIVDRVGESPTIEVYGVGQKGLSVRRWFSSSKKWGCDWYGFGHDAAMADPVAMTAEGSAGWDNALTVWKPDPSHASQREVAFGFRQTRSAPGKVALHTLDLSARTRTASIVNTLHHMSTQTGAFDGTAFRIFGDLMTNGFPLINYHFLDIPLEDMAVPPGSMPIQHHGPGEDPELDQVVVGPGGAAAISCPSNRVVTAIADTLLPADPMSSFELAQNGVFLFDSGSYVSLGAPALCDDPFFCPTPAPAAGPIFGGPLSVAFTNDFDGRQQLNVFATSRDERSHQYRLYESPTAACDFSSPVWHAYGAPPDVGPDVPFVMTSYVAWHDGATQRINLFGYTLHDSATNTPGRLISLYWDGSWWWWDGTRSVPDGGDFVTTSAVVIDQASYDRIAVYGRSSTGRIWELSYSITNGAQSGWKWADLTCVDKLCPVFQIP